MKAKEFIPTARPRNFVAKNAMKTTSGAGAHRDKKKEQKQGYEKHKSKSVAEYGDTAKGQKMLTKVQKRAVDRLTSKKADTDPKYAKKNQDTANRAWDRMSDVDEGWKDKIAAAGLAGAMALGASGASARAVPGQDVDQGFNRLTGKPVAQQQVDIKKQQAGKGFSKEYLQSVVDGKHPRPMISKEKAQELLSNMEEGRHGYDDAGFSLAPGHDEGEPVYNPRYDRTGQYDRKAKYSQDYNYNTGKPLGSEPKKKGFMFYNVADPQTAQKLGLKQTKSGKWYLPADDTYRQQTADKVFGKGRYWEPKN